MSMVQQPMKKIIGIDASRSRSGGVVAYVKGILGGADPCAHGVKIVHLWAHKSLMDQIPDYEWLVKHSPAVLQKSIVHQLIWQYYRLPKELKKNGCELLFNTNAGTICSFTPNVTISQDLLSFEPGERQRFTFSKDRLRLFLLRYIQVRSLKNATGVIFATHYVKEMLEPLVGYIKQHRVIPHGISNEFRQAALPEIQYLGKKKFECIYVSSALLYKHQWHVVEAITQLRMKGLDVSLLLIGGGKGPAQTWLEKQIAKSDPEGVFIKQLSFVPHDKIPLYLAKADISIFASSCENMPITLLESMAVGLPIACSNRGPMPEILEHAGEYFNPESADSIAAAVENLIAHPEIRKKFAICAKMLSEKYTWEKTAAETWNFIEVVI